MFAFAEHAALFSSIVNRQPRRIVFPRALFLAAFCCVLPGFAIAENDLCITDAGDPSIVVCSGDQSEGIDSGQDFPEDVETLNVNDLSAPIVTTAVNTSGIEFTRLGAGNVSLNSGESGSVVTIVTRGEAAEGIFAQSVGTPAAPAIDPFLDIPIPGEPAVSGGEVDVESFSDITTWGDKAHGISAHSLTTGYPDSVTSALDEFVASEFTFLVTSIVDPDGGPDIEPNNAVRGQLVMVDFETGIVTEIAGDGGVVTLNADGTFDLDTSTMTLPAENETIFVRVEYSAEGTNNTNGVTDQSQGTLLWAITGKAPGTAPVIEFEATFTDSSGGDKWSPTMNDALPDLAAFIAGLQEGTSAGGAGNSVTVASHNSIATNGNDAHGIFASSKGANGRNGSDATWGSSSTRGAPGDDGGIVTVTANGTISTSGDNAIGVFASSTGGNGGVGGDSGHGRNAKRGGEGGEGGIVRVTGDATITTSGDDAVGIFAVSAGGNGGGGGGGSTTNRADVGGSGGAGGGATIAPDDVPGEGVTVDGSWNITTTGDHAHGIWAKNTGGLAGGGGDGGWTGTNAAEGGAAKGGGAVNVISRGDIQTLGADAYGIFGQSVGGFGGAGGDGAGLFFAEGGDGTSAGAGGFVSVFNSGQIVTGDPGTLDSGLRAHGIFAQSIGGGGGAGGSGGALVGLGGDGATGGYGGDVEVTNAVGGSITTYGDNARGIYAQSVGGGGGDGGDSGGLVAIGGTGAKTSNGGTVDVINDGAIQTFGHRSNAIFAESVGGGGGDGGDSSGLVSIGGDGGGGGDGDNVAVSNTGILATTGADASAIFAQSVGGGGGNGGGSVAVGAFVSVAIGGNGDEGGNAGEAVTIANQGIISTTGSRSHGIHAQSVGGGGGNGGYAISIAIGKDVSLAVAVGGRGGPGGSGKIVVVTNDNSISTQGKDAHGIFAQSVGGGGGSGGFSIAASGSAGFSGALALGGNGGPGNSGGTVVVSNSGDISTGIADRELISIDSLEGIDAGIIDLLRDHGYGTIAELADADAADLALIAGIDGMTEASVDILAGFGIDAETIQKLKDAGILTIGDLQDKRVRDLIFIEESVARTVVEQTALYVQTIPATLLDQATLQMQRGNHAYGILAQSVGGGGGDGGFSVAGTMNAGGTGAAFSMGGAGGEGGSGGVVTLENSGNIETHGDDAHGIVAQSVGGGGGTGGFSVSGSLGTGSGFAASLGGSGGSGSTGGNVQVGQINPLSGNISTQGDHAYGVLAQSVGGGGGDGGFSVAGAINKGSSAAFSMGGSGGTAGVGGRVDLTSAANISTIGRDAHGLVAQSIGGGGGTGGFSVAGGLSREHGVAASIGGSGGTGGDAGDVFVVNSGVIQTGLGGQRSAGLGELESLDPDVLVLLLEDGIETIAELAATPQSELQEIDGIDETIANELVENANLFMQKDSHSYGILAQSVGGGGGDGGFSVAGSFSKDGHGAAFSMGGSGMSGGDGGNVNVRNDNIIITRAESSYGVFANSVGGGGGSGGFSVAGRITLGESRSGLSLSVGGSGAQGGDGGIVFVDNTGEIVTEGGNAHGIYALSVGGGGGAGGFSASGTISGSKSKQLGASVGGFGGVGGIGGQVDVINSGRITTLSEGANAIYAQSVGGGGGDGAISFAGTFAGSEAKQLSASVGGFGGAGQHGGNVTVVNAGTLDTYGAFANGIQAQSIGGGGGSGGFSVSTGFATSAPPKIRKFNGNVSVGGYGGKGGAGHDVLVRNCQLDENDECVDLGGNGPRITTRGDDSHGVFAQSIGGGGGDGGSSFSATVGLDPKTDGKSFNLGVSIGGIGGEGNVGGAVLVENDGVIDTLGHGAYGIFAQSVGGGGGTGGSARTFSIIKGKKAKTDPNDEKKERPKNGNKTLTVAIGGSGGDGGTGGDVTILNSGDVITRGADAHAVFGQSIGGGGGNGGNGAHGVPEVGGVTGPATDEAIEAGAEGGRPKAPKLKFDTLKVIVGGNGGTGNDGGRVDIEHAGNIITLFDGSIGILAQSIGAGGGIGANAVLGIRSTFGLGGGGGASGHGGAVTVNAAGNILTVGTSAHGIFAQSVGGGGGIAGDVDFGIIDSQEISRPGGTITTPTINIGVGLAVLREGGNAGNGGNVTVNSAGTITTIGHSAIGIFAQSVGGGGGLSGDTGFGLLNEIKNVASCVVKCDAWMGSAGGDGSGGVVNISHTGMIETFGDVAHGILAQSSGGAADDIQPMVIKMDDEGNVVTKPLLKDGVPVFDEFGEPVMVPVWEAAPDVGLLPDLDDLGGDINITIDGDILVHGEYAHGIFAHSAGDDGAGNITINLLGGTVQGGSNSGVGVRIKGGASNTLNNYGTLTSVAGVFGHAIFADSGDEVINNFGTIIGSVDLGIGANAFFNNLGAIFNSGTVVYLGAGNTLTNDGLLSPGGLGEVVTTNLTGDLLQSSTGSFAVDLDMQAVQADSIIQIGAADLSGSLELNVLNQGWVRPGSTELIILSATDGITDSGLSFAAPNSAVVNYEVVFPNASQMVLRWNVDFASVGLNRNSTAIGNYINAVQSNGGSSSFAPLVSTIFAAPDQRVLTAVYNTLSPQVVADNHIATLNSNMRFSDALLSCKVRDGYYRFAEERQCAWLSITLRDSSRNTTSEHMGFDENTWQVAGGLQKDLDNQWVIGGALSYENRNLSLSTGTVYSEGRRMQGGIVVKRRSGPSTFSTSFTTGFADFENMRVVLDGLTASGEQRTLFFAGQMRSEHTFEYSNLYIKPRFDLGITHFSRDGYQEVGRSGANLMVEDSDDTHIYAQLALETGAESILDSGMVFRPSIGIGLTHFLTDNQPTVTAAIIGVSSAAGTFMVSSDLDRTYVDFDLGFDFLFTSDVAIRLNAFGRVSSNTKSHGGTLKVSFPFGASQ